MSTDISIALSNHLRLFELGVPGPKANDAPSVTNFAAHPLSIRHESLGRFFAHFVYRETRHRQYDIVAPNDTLLTVLANVHRP